MYIQRLFTGFDIRMTNALGNASALHFYWYVTQKVPVLECTT